MSKVFYEKVVGLFLHFLVLILLIAIASLWLIFYVVFNHTIFYLFHFGMIFIAIFYGIRCYGNFRHFKENLHLFIPNSELEKPNESLNMDMDNKALKVCLYYRNGATFNQIQRTLGLSHGTQTRRLMIKGLDTLLKFYNEHNEKKVVIA